MDGRAPESRRPAAGVGAHPALRGPGVCGLRAAHPDLARDACLVGQTAVLRLGDAHLVRLKPRQIPAGEGVADRGLERSGPAGRGLGRRRDGLRAHREPRQHSLGIRLRPRGRTALARCDHRRPVGMGDRHRRRPAVGVAAAAAAAATRRRPRPPPHGVRRDRGAHARPAAHSGASDLDRHPRDGAGVGAVRNRVRFAGPRGVARHPGLARRCRGRLHHLLSRRVSFCAGAGRPGSPGVDAGAGDDHPGTCRPGGGLGHRVRIPAVAHRSGSAPLFGGIRRPPANLRHDHV